MKNNKISKFLLTILIFGCNVLLAQTGSVSGIVIHENTTLPGGVIRTEFPNINGVTNHEGKFTINNLPIGSRKLTISFIGFDTKEIVVDIKEDEIFDLNYIELTESTGILGEVIIEGTQGLSEARAISMQKKSIAGMQVIAADGIGKLPDRNAAESVQRIQGVSIERDQGEGRFVSIRGLPPFWSVTTINGNRIPTAEEETTTRATAFDFFPTEMIAYVQASKAPTPDMEADGIGGNVNFITRTSPVKETFSINVGGGYNAKAKKPIYNASLTYGNRSKNKKFGYIVNGSYWNRNWATDNFEARRKGDEGVYRLEIRDYNGERTTVGVNGAMEYKLNSKSKVYLKGMFGTLRDTEVHYKHRIRFDKFNATNNTLRVEMQNIYNQLITEFYGFDLGGEHSTKKGKLDWSASTYSNEFKYGSIPSKDDKSYYIVKYNQNGVAVDPTYLQDKGNGYRAYWKDDGGKLDYENTDALFGFIDDKDFKMDPTKMGFADLELYKVSIIERDKIVAGLNYEHEFNSKFKLKVGAKYRDKERLATFSDIYYGWSGAQTAPTLDESGEVIDLPGGDDYLEEMDANISSIYGGGLSTQSMEDFWNNNKDNNLEILEDDSEALKYNGGLGRNFNVFEKHASGYAMGTYTPNSKWTILGGVRTTHTSTKVEGYRVVDSDLETVDRKKEYLAILPMIHFKYSPKKDLIFRLSGTRTFARPNYGDITTGGTYISFDNEFKGGNPDLNPTYSWNLDLLGEYYFKNIGVINGGVFYKSITDPVFSDTYQGTYNGNDGVEFSTPNNGSNAWIGGVELGINKRFDFLPGIFKYFGTQLNATFMESEMTKPSGRVVDAPYQAKQLFNAQLYFEKNGLNLRVAFNHKGKYAIAYGKSDLYDVYYGKYNTLDFSASYTFKKKFNIYADLNNLLNAPLVYHYGEKVNRPKQVEFYGVRGMIGFKYSF